MSATIGHDLVQHLRWEVAHLREERDLLLRERDQLLGQDLDGILACLKEKEILRTQAKILEESRAFLREDLKALAGGEAGAGTFGRLLERVSESERSDLLASKGDLDALVAQVDLLAEGNRYLIQSALGRVGRSVAFLSQFVAADAPVYRGDGLMAWRDDALPRRLSKQA